MHFSRYLFLLSLCSYIPISTAASETTITTSVSQPKAKITSLYTSEQLEEMATRAIATNNLELYKTEIKTDHSTLAHYLALARKSSPFANWTTHNPEILTLTNDGKYSVALLLAFKSKLDTTDKAILSLKGGYDDETVAHSMARTGKLTVFDKDILTLRNKKGETVAHSLSYDENVTLTDKNILMLRDNQGLTVYHHFAYWNPKYTTDDPEILRISSKSGRTVAHLLAMSGFSKGQWKITDKSLLGLEDYRGRSVASVLARNHDDFVPTDFDVLNMPANKEGTKVAHVLAIFTPKFLPTDMKVLSLRDSSNRTVAHILARNNPKFLPHNKEVLLLEQGYKETVAHILAKRNFDWTTDDPSILNLVSDFDVSVSYLLLNREKWR